MAGELVPSRSRRGWAVIASVFTSLMLTIVLAAQDQPPPPAPIVVDKKRSTPLLTMNFSVDRRADNLQIMINNPAVLAIARQHLEKLDAARDAQLQNMRTNLEKLRPSLFSAFCAQSMPTAYQGLHYLIHDVSGVRDVPLLPILIDRGFQRQTWLDDDLLQSIYERWELGQQEERSTLMGVSGAILDAPGRYFATLLWLTEIANAPAPQGLGVCTVSGEAPAKASGQPAAPPPGQAPPAP
jgi:hypothetical protein